jgi:UDP-N-acetylmuramoyl-tripeptide--D-alanyl-D-alanine ligase
MNWTAGQLADITRGTLHASADIVVHGVSTDSRELLPGDVFVAIVGERFDGAEFATAAMHAGAVLVIAEREVGVPCIVVHDVQRALGMIARAHLDSLPNTKVIAITGSSGKTSTKDLVAQVLSEAGKTLSPIGSFNNEIGLPRTVLQATPDTEFLVLEMGMRGIGHIAALCDIAPPDIATVLNVGSAHIGIVGSRDGIANGKSEILQALHPDGLAVINRDDHYAPLFRERARCPHLEFGIDDGQVHASDVVLDASARPSFQLHIGSETAPVTMQQIGEHHVANALAAAAIAHACGMSTSGIAAALSSAVARSHWRMELHELANGVTVINDAYNANPESMRTALRSLAAMGKGKRTWAVLGEMRELGDVAVEEHDALGRLVVRLDISKLVAIGDMGKLIQMGAAHEGSWGDEAVHVHGIDDAVQYITERWQSGDLILIKASRSIGLERVAQALLDAGSGKN